MKRAALSPDDEVDASDVSLQTVSELVAEEEDGVDGPKPEAQQADTQQSAESSPPQEGETDDG